MGKAVGKKCPAYLMCNAGGWRTAIHMTRPPILDFRLRLICDGDRFSSLFATGVSFPVAQELKVSSELKPLAAGVVSSVDFDEVEVLTVCIDTELVVELKTGSSARVGVEVCDGESV